MWCGTTLHMARGKVGGVVFCHSHSFLDLSQVSCHPSVTFRETRNHTHTTHHRISSQTFCVVGRAKDIVVAFLHFIVKDRRLQHYHYSLLASLSSIKRA